MRLVDVADAAGAAPALRAWVVRPLYGSIDVSKWYQRTVDQVPVTDGDRRHRVDIKDRAAAIGCALVKGDFQRQADHRADGVLRSGAYIRINHLGHGQQG